MHHFLLIPNQCYNPLGMFSIKINQRSDEKSTVNLFNRWIGEKYDGVRCCWHPHYRKVYHVTIYLFIFLNLNVDTLKMVMSLRCPIHNVNVCHLLLQMESFGNYFCFLPAINLILRKVWKGRVFTHLPTCYSKYSSCALAHVEVLYFFLLL